MHRGAQVLAGAVEVVGPQPDQAARDQAVQAGLVARFADVGEQGERGGGLARQRHPDRLGEPGEPAHPRLGRPSLHRGRAVFDHFRIGERENPDNGELRGDPGPQVRGPGPVLRCTGGVRGVAGVERGERATEQDGRLVDVAVQQGLIAQHVVTPRPAGRRGQLAFVLARGDDVPGHQQRFDRRQHQAEPGRPRRAAVKCLAQIGGRAGDVLGGHPLPRGPLQVHGEPLVGAVGGGDPVLQRARAAEPGAALVQFDPDAAAEVGVDDFAGEDLGEGQFAPARSRHLGEQVRVDRLRERRGRGLDAGDLAQRGDAEPLAEDRRAGDQFPRLP